MAEATLLRTLTTSATRAPDAAELKRLYEAHAELVRSLVARLLGPSGGADVDDLTHEVFLVAWRRPEHAWRGIAERAWLCGVAIKLAQAARRRRRLRQFLGLAAAMDLSDGRTPATALESGEASRLVYGVLERLSEKKRLVFILFELQELTGPEIAHALGCPLQTVKTRLFHARREFQVGLERWKAEEEARVEEKRR